MNRYHASPGKCYTTCASMSDEEQHSDPQGKQDELLRVFALALAESDEVREFVGGVLASAVVLVAAKTLARQLRDDVARRERELTRAEVARILSTGLQSREQSLRSLHGRRPNRMPTPITWPEAIARGAASLLDFMPDEDLPESDRPFESRRSKALQAEP